MVTHIGKVKPVRYGMVGGGVGAFIGAVHRMAARLDGQLELVCGAFSTNPQNSLRTGQQLGLEAARCYPTFQAMFEAEAQLDSQQRMQFVVIVTPNHLHFPIACAAIERGFHVFSDKPATLDLPQVLAIQRLLHKHPVLYGLTHTYAGYPMVTQAREMVARGQLGRLRKIIVEYTQGWLASKDAETGKQAAWRLDPQRAGEGGCIGDIGTHAAHLAEYISGDKISAVCAELNALVDGRLLDDDATVLLKFDNGANGVLLASQVAVGEENNLRIRLYGDQASLEWQQMEPNSLIYSRLGEPKQVFRAGEAYLYTAAQQGSRLPAGHPEGYLEAFANLYSNFAARVRAHQAGESPPNHCYVPGIDEAVRGMAFVHSVVQASQSERKWHPLRTGELYAQD